MEPPTVNPTTTPVTNPPSLRKGVNITVATAAIPGYVIMHDKSAVAISGQKLGEVLSQLYEAGFRYVEAIVEVAGQRIVVEPRSTANTTGGGAAPITGCIRCSRGSRCSEICSSSTAAAPRATQRGPCP